MYTAVWRKSLGMMENNIHKVQDLGSIVLIGFMGSGKSSVGRRLSYRLKVPFIDTDSEIERTAGCTIADIFEERGESAFREAETDCLSSLVPSKRGKGSIVISTGGGVPLREENRNIIKRLGTVVYLKASPETIYERIKDDTSRPLLNTDDPMKKIRMMMQERSGIYSMAADIEIDTDGKLCRDIADEIIRRKKALL